MRPRPLYRSRLLWLGVPGLVFLLWVWWDSGGYESRARWTRAERWAEVLVDGGRLKCVRTQVPANLLPYLSSEPFSFERVRRRQDGLRGWLAIKGEPRQRQFDFPAAFGNEEAQIREIAVITEGARVEWHMALWVIVAGYVVVWLGAVFAWQRRKVRVMKALTESTSVTEVVG